jgi:hypothetical protein
MALGPIVVRLLLKFRAERFVIKVVSIVGVLKWVLLVAVYPV